MFSLSKLSPDDLVILGALLTVVLTQNTNADQLNVLGNFVTEIGSSLLTKAAQTQAVQAQEDLTKQIQDVEDQLVKLKKQLC